MLYQWLPDDKSSYVGSDRGVGFLCFRFLDSSCNMLFTYRQVCWHTGFQFDSAEIRCCYVTFVALASTRAGV